MFVDGLPGNDTLRLQQQRIEAGSTNGVLGDALQQDTEPTGSTAAELAHLPTETPCFKIDKVEFENNPFRSLDQVIATVQGQCAGVAGLKIVQDATAAVLIEQGYVTSRVSVPAQSLTSGTLRLDLGMPRGTWGKARAGVAQVWTAYHPRSSIIKATDNGDGDWSYQDAALSGGSTSQTVGTVGLTIDQLDDLLFPRHGFYLDSGAQFSLSRIDGSYNIAQARGLWAMSHGIYSVNAAIEAGGQFGGNRETPAYLFNLGGFQRLSAYAPDQFSGSYIRYGRVTGFAQRSKFDSGPLRGVFAGASLEAGNVWNSPQHFARGPWLTSASVFAGSTTVTGPVYLGLALAPGGTYNVYFQLGNRF